MKRYVLLSHALTLTETFLLTVIKVAPLQYCSAFICYYTPLAFECIKWEEIYICQLIVFTTSKTKEIFFLLASRMHLTLMLSFSMQYVTSNTEVSILMT